MHLEPIFFALAALSFSIVNSTPIPFPGLGQSSLRLKADKQYLDAVRQTKSDKLYNQDNGPLVKPSDCDLEVKIFGDECVYCFEEDLEGDVVCCENSRCGKKMHRACFDKLRIKRKSVKCISCGKGNMVCPPCTSSHPTEKTVQTIKKGYFLSDEGEEVGPIVCFNLRTEDGVWNGHTEVRKA
jgi:hypothetical protein